MILDTTYLAGFSLLLLRLIIATIFFVSGIEHIKDPKKRGESIGMSPAATTILGVAEIVGAISVALGVFAQIGAILIMGAMLGAIYKKVFVWKKGFFENEGYGWHYDLLLLIGALVIFATHGGNLILI